MTTPPKNVEVKSSPNVSIELLKEYRDKLIHNVEPLEEQDLEQRETSSVIYQLQVMEANQILKLRRSWSDIFKVTLIVILTFEIFIALAVGIGWLVYEDIGFLNVIVIGGFANILAMPVIITKFLFSNESSVKK